MYSSIIQKEDSNSGRIRENFTEKVTKNMSKTLKVRALVRYLIECY